MVVVVLVGCDEAVKAAKDVGGVGRGSVVAGDKGVVAGSERVGVRGRVKGGKVGLRWRLRVRLRVRLGCWRRRLLVMVDRHGTRGTRGHVVTVGHAVVAHHDGITGSRGQSRLLVLVM